MLGICTLLMLLFPHSYSLFCTRWVPVEPGGNCWQIADSRGIDVSKLISMNPGLDCNLLQVGQKICVQQSRERPPCTKWYSIVSGDFCYKIWTDNNLSEEILKELNPDLNCNGLQVGGKICVGVDLISTTSMTTKQQTTTTSVPRSTNFCSQYYSIKNKDTCYDIANSNNQTIVGLTDANPGLNCDVLMLGERICLSETEKSPMCGRWHVIKEGDTCYSIKIQNEMADREFSELNDELNCNVLQVGAEVCIGTISKTIEKPSERNETECEEYYTVAAGDTCYKISIYFHMKLSDLENKYKCNQLNIGDKICVSETESCQMRYQIKSGDNCQRIKNSFKLFDNELEDLNEDFSCDNLEIDRKICVWPETDRLLGNTTCTQRVTLEKEQSCLSLAQTAGIPIDAFKFLNPEIECVKSLPRGSTPCIAAGFTKKCSGIDSLNKTYTCSQVADLHFLSVTELLHLNPILRCDRINITEQICTGFGYFLTNECTESLRVTDELPSCSNISKVAGINEEIIKKLNTGIDCSKNLNISSLVCIASLGMDTTFGRDKFISTLSQSAPELVEAYKLFSQNPNKENSVAVSLKLQAALLNMESYKIIKELYKTDSDFRKIVDSQHPMPRIHYCEEMKNSGLSDSIKNCYCGSDELLLFCQTKGVQEIQDALNEDDEVIRKRRFVGCSLGDLWPEFSPEAPTTLSMFGNCWGGGCSVPLGIVELSLDGDICVPPIKIDAGKITFCGGKAEDCADVKEDDEKGLGKLASISSSAGLKLCITGTSILKKISKFLGFACWTIADAELHPFVGRLRVGTELNLQLFKLKGGAKIKVYDMAFPDMCDIESFECEDYCLFRYNNWKNGRAYGYIEFRLFSFFGFSGVKLVNEEFKGPERLGCKGDMQAAVVIMNKRTCENREIYKRCWQGKQKKEFTILEDEWGFEFKPGPRTLHVCEFIDPNGQKIGFDVYKGKSKNKGRKTFYYSVQNDGIYRGESRYKQENLIASWDNPCEEKEKEITIPKPDDAKEPTGSSSVSASSCGKRIVGYYTGWGDREITENQLKKLTHVIFAFVAMSADGSVAFGPVSEDDSGPEAGKKAEKRFLDMKRKARAVNAGVQILFAVGGWDNSQYFSSVAGDSSKRKRFVDSVVDFLDTHGIDGVDIDWEYPVTGGAHEGVAADKDNYVTLLRELREKLDSKARKTKYLITLASAAGEWTIRPGYDLNGILRYADFINVMTYDYYGAWGSKWGAYTGTPSPLYFGSLKGFSGKLNADFTMRFYSCRSKKPSQLNMGVPFYGRFWENVGGAIDASDPMWRTADPVGGVYKGGYVAWRNLEKEGWNKNSASFHDKTKTPYIFNSGSRKFLGFENEQSLREKIKYATEKNIGGLMIWAIDLDDEADTLLSLVSSAGLCNGGSGDTNKYECVPIDDVRWWTPENSDPDRQGQCGRSAPLINGYYPVCDPDDPGFACCGAAGYCGSGEEYCKCKGCVDYRSNPKAILDEPVKPSRPIQWYTMDAPDGKRGRCGKDVPQIGGKMAICNPDDPAKHCCSNGGYCGTGKEFCECDGCVDYKK